MKSNSKGVALIASARTPFLNTATAYSTLMSYELAAYAIEGVMKRCPRAIDDLGLVVLGTVLHEVNTTNVAREAMLRQAYQVVFLLIPLPWQVFLRMSGSLMSAI